MTDDTPHLPVRACRDCGEEYRPGILVCADCGGEVVERRGDEPPAAEEAAPAEPAAHEGLSAIYSSARMHDLMPMCDRLAEAAVEHRVHERPPSARGESVLYAIIVHESDRLRALEALADLIAPHETGDVRAIEHAFDPERGYLQCPSCGASPPAGASECPECGLGLPGEEAAPEPSE